MSIQLFAHFKIGLSDFPHARRKWRWRRGGAPGGWEVRRWRPLRAGRRPGVRTAGELAGGQRPPWADGWTRWVPRPPGSRACSFQSAGPALPGSGAWVPDCGSPSWSGHLTDEPFGGDPVRRGRRTDKPSGVGSRVRKSRGFSEWFELSFYEQRCQRPLVCVFYFYHFKKKPVHHCLCFPQWINFVVSCYLFIALN